jgi:hypothetical protein
MKNNNRKKVQISKNSCLYNKATANKSKLNKKKNLKN